MGGGAHDSHHKREALNMFFVLNINTPPPQCLSLIQTLGAIHLHIVHYDGQWLSKASGRERSFLRPVTWQLLTAGAGK